MTDLIKRLEEAEEGSRELDALIWAHTHPEPVRVLDWNECYGDTARTQVRFKVLPGRRENVTSARGPYLHAEPFTTSLDAALALAERVLPGLYMWNVEFDDEPTSTPASAKVYAERDGQGCAATPALALCIAILKATDTGRE